MHDRGVLLAFAGLVCGILAGERAGPAPAVGALAIGLGALGAAWFFDGRARLVLAVVALALIGSAQAQRASNGQARSALARAIAREEPATVSGVLVDDPHRGRFDTTAL